MLIITSDVSLVRQWRMLSVIYWPQSLTILAMFHWWPWPVDLSHWVYAFGCSTVCVRQHIVQFHPWQADGWYLLVFININISVTFVNLQYWGHHGFYPCDKVLALGTSYSQVSVSVCLSQVVVQLNWLDGLSWFFWHGGFLQPVLQCVWTKFRYLPI